MFRRGFFLWGAIIGLIPAVVKLALSGAISPGEAAGILIALVAILAVSRRALGGAAPFIAVYVLIRSLAMQNKAAVIALTSQVLTLSIILLGFWIMFQGLMPRRRRE